MSRIPLPALWILVFAAVLGHFPGLAFDFARNDFASLAAGAGLDQLSGWPPRAWTELGTWNLWWRLGGASAAVSHGAALLLVAWIAVFTARIGARLGLDRTGAVVAGSWTLLGPVTGYATAWTTASAPLWAAAAALLGLDLWLGRHPRRDPPLALICLAFSLFSTEMAMALPLVFLLAGHEFGPREEGPRLLRGRWVLVLVALALSVVATRMAAHLPPIARDLRPHGSAIHLVLQTLGLASWPWPAAPGPIVSAWIGGLVAVLAVGLLILVRGDRARTLRLGFLWTAATLLPVLLLPKLELGTSAVGPAIGLAWVVGCLSGPALGRLLERIRHRVRIAEGLALLLLLLVAGPLWGTLRAGALDRPGAWPALESSRITSSVRRQLAGIFSAPTPPEEVFILQATRDGLPEDIGESHPEGVLLASPVFVALQGSVGPRLMLHNRTPVHWGGLLDEATKNASVFLDVGDARLRPLGPVENARFYAALIAVAAGQFDLARHEFWSIIEFQGARVSFAFQPDNLPIAPAELDAEAANFARWLRQEGSPSSLRIAKLFASVYKSVRGRNLIEEGWGKPLHSGRVDG